VYSDIHAVKTQKISQIVSLYNKQHYVIYNNHIYRPCKRAIIRLFTEPLSRLHKRNLGGRDLALYNYNITYRSYVHRQPAHTEPPTRGKDKVPTAYKATRKILAPLHDHNQQERGEQ